MDVTAIAAAATTMAQVETASAVQLAVLRKALDIEGQGALQLVQAVVQPQYNNPALLGNAIDVVV
jgi:hypothetical protein